MNPIKYLNCIGFDDCPPLPFLCRWDCGGKKTNAWRRGEPKYYCPHEWEISAVKKK